MHGNKTYVIRRKIVKLEPTPVPESTFKPDGFERKATKISPIKAAPQFEELALPKKLPVREEPNDPLPKFENPPPTYEPVDFRVNAAVLRRDFYLKQANENREKNEKDKEPTDFLAWQSQMKKQDELERLEIIEKRHKELDQVRRKAIKAKKDISKKRLELGQDMRNQITDDIRRVNTAREEEMNQLLERKATRVDRAPLEVERVRRQKAQCTKEIKIQIREELKSARRQKEQEFEAIKQHAEKVRYDAIHHTNRHGDVFTAKREITDTKFLAELTDEETVALRRQNQEATKRKIEADIVRHQKEKAETINELEFMLEDVTTAREQREDEHKAKRQEKKQQAEKERLERQRREEEQMLELEKRQERKRKERLKEAEQMEEHTRQIAARNRYLALNKKALETRGFESRQDAALRSARDRQLEKTNADQAPPKKQKPKGELVRLKQILGL